MEDPGYGLRVQIIADWNSDYEGSGTYEEAYRDPGIDTLAKGFVKLITATFDWGSSRREVIARLIDELEAIAEQDMPRTISVEEFEHGARDERDK